MDNIQFTIVENLLKRIIELLEEKNKPIKTERRESFKKPTEEDISQYIEENNYDIKANDFFNYYEANNWKIGKNKMKDWKATVRMWHSRGNKKSLYENITI